MSSTTSRYFHDPVQRVIYKHDAMPEVVDQRSSGKLIGWKVRIHIDVVRSDNRLTSLGRWQYATFECPDQDFDALRYSRDQAMHYFMARHSAEKKSASTEEIDEGRYEQLKTVYNAEACANRGAPE